jgi:serine/threonine-protein kinase
MDSSKTMTICPACLSEVPGGESFCISCGHSLGESATPNFLIGTVIGDKFRLDSVLGEGAMGTVYKATQIALDTAVAVKILHPHLAGDRNLARRFHREARAASRLNHPNSLRIIDFGQTHDHSLYIAMEYIEGRHLQDVIVQDFPLPLERIVHLAGQVCDALEEAHAAGIVHRDLKPENIMVVVRRDGREDVKVCDFGIAKIQDPGDNEASAPITVAGIVCGTPEYMSPEQCRGEQLDGRADIYSLGMILYQLATRSLPFTADTPLGVVTRQLTDDPPRPSSIHPDSEVARALENVVLRAIAKSRKDRYGSALELKADLERVLAGGVVAPPPPPSPPTLPKFESAREPRRKSSGVAIAVAVGAGALALALAAALLVPGLLGGRAAAPGAAGDDRGATRTAPDASAAAIVPTPGDPTGRADAGPVETVPIAPGDAGPGPTAADADGAADALAAADAGARSRTKTDAPGRHADKTPRERPRDAGAEAPAEKGDFELGRDAYLIGDCATALGHFEKARQSSPGNAEVQRMLGKCYMRVGRTAEGRDAYRRYLELRPTASDRAFIEQIIGQ